MSYIHTPCKYEFHNVCNGYAFSGMPKDKQEITCDCQCHKESNE